MKTSTQKVLTGILAVLSFPFFTAGILNGKQALVVEKQPVPESFLAPVTAAEIPEDYPLEAVKAQAVLVRTRYALEMNEGKGAEEVVKEMVSTARECKEKTGKRKTALCETAVKETKDVIMTYEGTPVECPFFAVSNGVTRSGAEVFGKEDFSWLVQTESPWDIDSEEYLTGILFTPDEVRSRLGSDYGAALEGKQAKEAAEQIKILSTDAAGYVMEVSVGENRIAGEAFRELLDLPSSCFSVQEIDGKIRFLCKGLGHGLGLSQTGAAAMAEEGKSWKDILNYYFPSLVPVQQ